MKKVSSMTIEERAKEYAQAYTSKESAVQWTIERAYGTGATDQKQIDIEKACEYLSHCIGIMPSFVEEFEKIMKE